MKFSELQQQLKKEFGIDHLADIARELGVSPQAVSNWKARDRVPYKYVLKIRQQLEESDTRGSNQSGKNASDANQVISQYGYSQYQEEDSIALTDILLVLARQLKIIIITPTVLCTLTIFYVFFIAQPVYESTAKIMSSSGGVQSQAGGLAAQFGINFSTGQSDPEWVYTEIIKSRTLARAMLKRKFDTHEFGPKKSLLQILTYGNDEIEFGIDTLEILAVNSFLDMIELSEDPQSGVYTITISASEPTLASELNASLIEELDKHQREYNKSKTSETRKFIEERIVDTEKELNDAEETLKDFRDRNRRIQNSAALQLDQQRLVREVAVLTGVFTTLKQQLETTKIEEVKDSDYVLVLDPPEPPIYRSKPKRRQMVILVGILGIGLGMMISFVKEYAQNSIDKEQKKMSNVKSIFIQNSGALIPQGLKKLIRKIL